MKALFVGAIVSLMLLGVSRGIYKTNNVEIKRANYSASTWEVVKSNGIANPYSIDTAGTITEQGNTAWLANYWINKTDTVYGDYKISATIQGTETLPNKREMHAGFIPWYLDENNYIMCYMRWENTDKPNSMSEIEVTGKIDGNFMVMWKNDQFIVSEWNDMWTDNRSQSAGDECIFTVEKKRTEANDSDYIRAYISWNGEADTLIGFHMTRDAVKYDDRKAHFGVYGYNDKFTFKDITITNENNSKVFAPVGDGMGQAINGTLSYDDAAKSYSLTSSSSTAYTDNMLILDNNVDSDNYSISSDISVTPTDTSELGILVYYKDGYNYLAAVIKKENGETKVGFKGKFTTAVGSNLTVNEVDTLATSTFDLSALTSLKVQKNGIKFKLFLNGNEEANFERSSCTGKGKVGFAGANIGFTASNILIEKVAYVAYDWYSTKFVGDTTCYVSAKVNEGGISYADGVYTIPDAAVDSENTSNITSFYYGSSFYGDIAVKATFSGIKADSIYGVYPWIQDPENFLRVLVKPDGITIENHFGENPTSKQYALPEGVNYTSGDKILNVEIKSQKVYVTWGGVDALDGAEFTMAGNDLAVAPNIGIAVAKNGILVKKIATTGFTPYSERKEGDWKFYGARLSSWTVSDDGKTVDSSFDGGTGWKQTLALTSIPDKKDYYFASKVKVHEVTGSDYKTGFMPYYLDGSNYVFIWISQFAGVSPELVVSCMLNGNLVGYEWRKTAFTYSYMETEVQLEAKIEGDVVSVYINKSFSPTFSTTFEGLSNRTTAGAYAGFNSVSSKATYYDYHFSTDTRNFTMTEKPVIEETGTRKTSGIIGNRITLPIFTGTNSSDEVLNPVVTVTDPNGANVELMSNRFTPDTLGDYVVRVTCTDNWGNEAEPLVYTITITEEQQISSSITSENPSSEISSSQGNNSQSTSENSGNNNGNTGAIVGASVAGGVVVLGGGGAGLYFFLKKRKHL